MDRENVLVLVRAASGVSGGSITAGVLALTWDLLACKSSGVG